MRKFLPHRGLAYAGHLPPFVAQGSDGHWTRVPASTGNGIDQPGAEHAAGSSFGANRKWPGDPRQLQADFFRRMGGDQQVRHLLDCVPDVLYAIKDSECRYMAAGKSFYQRMGLASEDELIGRTAVDFYPTELAERFTADDRRILTTGEPLRNMVEAWFAPQGGFDLWVVDKLPVRDPGGAIIGVMGTLRPHEQMLRYTAEGTTLEKVVAYIRQHLAENIEVGQLTRIAGLSQRQLTRKFHDLFGMSARDFILFTRLQSAAHDLICTRRRVSEIAADYGFYDQSAFTYQFHRRMGQAPLEFRKRYGRGEMAADSPAV
jgi:AraC-like DNA-binding protein